MGHQGGRYLWQMKRAADLLVAWKEAEELEPRALEIQYLERFKAAHGRLPFANLVG